MDEAHYRLLRLLDSSPQLTQRELAREMGVSLINGNYCEMTFLRSLGPELPRPDSPVPTGASLNSMVS